MKNILYFLFALIVSMLISCENMMDKHLHWFEGGEKIYAPKVDSLVFFNGMNRVLMKLWLLESPNVKSVDVFWNNNKDSIIIPVSPSTGRDSLTFSIPLDEEKSYTFYVRTTDIFNNHSLKFPGSATSFGEIYKSSLMNRGVRGAQNDNSITEIQWFGSPDFLFCTEVRYTDLNNEKKTIRTFASESSTICPMPKPGSVYEYRSLYCPENSIDTFYLDWVQIKPVAKFDRSLWEILSVSDENPSYKSINILDNDLNTFWHSEWKPVTPLPHWLVIDMQATKEITRIDTYRRKNNTNTRTVEYYINEDPDPFLPTWKLIASGTYSSGDLMILNVSDSAQGRYLKILLPDTNAADTSISIAEIEVFGIE